MNDADRYAEEQKKDKPIIKIENNGNGDSFIWILFISFVLFYNFGNNEYDLYDALYKFFLN